MRKTLIGFLGFVFAFAALAGGAQAGWERVTDSKGRMRYRNSDDNKLYSAKEYCKREKLFWVAGHCVICPEGKWQAIDGSCVCPAGQKDLGPRKGCSKK